MATVSLLIFSPVSNLNADEEEQYKKSKFEAAAKCIFNTLDNTLKKQYKEKDIYNWLLNIDKDGDGTITRDEVTKAGGDKFNILKLSEETSKEEHDLLQAAITKEQELCGIKGMEKGLNTDSISWNIAKKFIIKYTSKEGIISMFESQEVRNYYVQMIEKNPRCGKHMKEVLRAHKFSNNEIISLGLNSNLTQDLLS